MSAPWKSVRIFISSTFRDMHAERDHLIKVTFPRLRLWCEQRRLRLVDIDLRWGVTQEEADNGRALEICLKEIDGSRPFFLCLLGERYGYVPPSLPPATATPFRLPAQPGHSITHLEIMHAALDSFPDHTGTAPGLCEHCFFYFRDPTCLPPPAAFADPIARAEFERTFFEAPPSPSQPQDCRHALAQLKEQLRVTFGKRGLITTYRGDWDAQAENPEDEKLHGRLANLDEFGARVEADLQGAIEKQFATHLASLGAPVDALAEERALHESFIENRTQIHVPRTDIERQLSDYTAGDDPQPLILSGPPGSGKSAILAHWVAERQHRTGKTARDDDDRDPSDHADRSEFLAARFIGASPSSLGLHGLLGSLSAELMRHFDLPESPATEVPAPTDIQNRWLDLLKAAGDHGRVVIVIDAVNQLERNADPRGAHWIPRHLPAGVRLIVSATDHGLDAAAAATPSQADWLGELRSRSLPEVRVPLLSDADRQRIIRELPSVFCKTLDAAQIALLLRNQATRNPLFLTVALEELRVFGSFEKVSAAIAALPRLDDPGPGGDISSALNSLFGNVLDRLDRESHRLAPGLAPRLFTLLAKSRDGLSEQELDGLLTDMLPPAEAAARRGQMHIILRQVRAYLHRKQSTGVLLVDFYHRSFWKAVVDKYLVRPEDHARLHREIAAFFSAQENFLESLEQQRQRALTLPPTSRPVNQRRVVELPWQRLQAALHLSADPAQDHLWEAMARGLMDGPFLEAKAEAGMIFDLAADFTAALAAPLLAQPHRHNLRLLEEAIRRDIHFLARHPTMLFQCLWNLCWWHDSPQAALHHPTGRGRQTSAEHPLCEFLESWRAQKETATPGFHWLRALLPPLMPLGSAQLAILRGHCQGVERMILSPDGRRIWSEAGDSPLRLWDAQSGAEVATFDVHSGGLVMAPDGHYMKCLLTADHGSVLTWPDETLHLWDTRSGAQITTFSGHENEITCVVLSPDGQRLVTGCDGGNVRLWDMRDGTLITAFTEHQEAIRSAAFSPDGRSIITGSQDKTARLWDAQSGEQQVIFDGHEGDVAEVSFSPDGSRVLTLAWFDIVQRLWDAASGTLLAIFDKNTPFAGLTPTATQVLCQLWAAHNSAEAALPYRHESAILSAIFSPDGKYILSWARDHHLRLWHHGNGREAAVLRGHEGQITEAIFTPDGTQILSTAADHTLRLWDTHTATAVTILRGHDFSLSKLAFSPDGRRILTWSHGNDLRLWDRHTGAEISVFPGHEDSITCAAFFPDGQRAVSGSDDWTLRIWDTHQISAPTAPKPNKQRVTKLTFSPDGCRLVSAAKDMRLWDALTGLERSVLSGHADDVTQLIFSPGGHRLVSLSKDKTARLWDAHDGTNLAVFREAEGAITSVHFSPSGHRLLTLSNNHCIHLYDGRSGIRIASLGRHGRLAQAPMSTLTPLLAFSPDETRLITTSHDNTLRLWDTATGAIIALINVHEEEANSLAFFPDGRRIFSASLDFSDHAPWRIWDTETGAVRILRHTGFEAVTNLHFSPNNKHLLVGSLSESGAQLWIWDAATGESLAVLPASDGHAITALFSPDGLRIINQTTKAIQVWDAHTYQPLTATPSDAALATAATPPAPDFHIPSSRSELETPIPAPNTSHPAAWLPQVYENLTTTPTRHLWAGTPEDQNDLAIYKLEGSTT